MPDPGKILIVDDEAHVRKFVSLIVRELGNPAIVEAADGAEAIVRFRAEAPDLVLLDVNMPGMDGTQTLVELLRTNPQAIVVMLTSLANRQTVERCLHTGAAGYIRKDTPKDSIVEELRTIIDRHFAET